MTSRKIELLAPAANAEVAIEAILHGADAVYIGPPSHGARKNASNSISDLKRVVEFAHQYGAKVYATVNTIVYDHELKDVERLIRELYVIGVDALIVQDMGILRLDIPPIELHASTQCDTRTVEKALFLEKVGFSQIVLARELTLQEISDVCRSVSVPVETFVHGALCVSYSGRCHASQALLGRSANRGECAQICRLPFTLTDADGKVLASDRHLLSLKDFNASDRLEQLLEAGVSSLKIEGRLKDASYVKNVVAYYRHRLDEIIAKSNGLYIRSSYGQSEIKFRPQLDKSFNRGFTHYFLDGPRPSSISSPLTPKSMGEIITDVSQLHNGDGISFFNSRRQYEGVMVNGIEGKRIIPNRPVAIPKGVELHRTLDIQWEKCMAKNTAERRLWLDVRLTDKSLSARDERGSEATVRLDADIQQARTAQDLRRNFDRLGNTIYRLREFTTTCDSKTFIPASQLADARRRLLDALEAAARAGYNYGTRRHEDPEAKFPTDSLDYQDNVANHLAHQFYTSHGVTEIEPALETKERGGATTEIKNGMQSVMTTRHCILRESGRCLRCRSEQERDFRLPLHITSGHNRFRLEFDCKRCEMHLML